MIINNGHGSSVIDDDSVAVRQMSEVGHGYNCVITGIKWGYFIDLWFWHDFIFTVLRLFFCHDEHFCHVSVRNVNPYGIADIQMDSNAVFDKVLGAIYLNPVLILLDLGDNRSDVTALWVVIGVPLQYGFDCFQYFFLK